MKHKAAEERYELIDKCLKNRDRKWTREALHKEVNSALQLKGRQVAVTTIDNDIKKMRKSVTISERREGRANIYYYPEEGLSYKPPVLSGEEKKKFSVSALFAKQVQGFSIGDELLKLAKKLGCTDRIVIDPETPLIDFGTAPVIPGSEFLDTLFIACCEKTVVEIKHQAYHAKQPRVWQLHPYMIKQYNLMFYLFCRNHQKNDYSVFALDRMHAVKPAVDVDYIESGFANNKDYFKDVKGVTVPKGEKPQDIELIFTPVWGPYVKATPLHTSQRVLTTYTNGNVHISLKMIINPELITLLLSYGNDVKVIKSARLIEELYKKKIDSLNGME